MKKVYLLLLTLIAITTFKQDAVAQAAGALPVVLVGFSTNLTNNNKITISWTTQQEVNTDCFNVEKSNDGIAWNCIATVKATGNSAVPVTYNAEDMFPLKGSNFYRIAIKSQSGAIGRTITKNVRVSTPCSIAIYPNPSTNIVNISLGEIPPVDWSLSLVNSMGQIIFQKKYNRLLTTTSLAVNNYLNGNYILEINDGKSRHSNTLMINHH